MLKINDKTFLNIQEAVQWLLDNNALPFQCTANYAANTEIGLGTIINPTMAKVRIGSLIFFADSKVSTVTGITANGFIVSDQYNDLVDDVVYVSNVQLNASGHLIVTLSNGTQIDAGLIKQVSGFSINGSQHLIAAYNDGTTTDLGAIFTGNVTISGDLTAVNGIFHGSVKSTYYEPDTGDTLRFTGKLDCFEKIYDSAGHQRFFESDIGVITAYQQYLNMDNIYGKWSLSGTHLLIVLSGEIKAGTVPVIVLDNKLAPLNNLPTWVLNKIKNVFGNDSYLEGKVVQVANFSAGVDTALRFGLRKYNSRISIELPDNFTLSNVAYFRVSFDLLIDND